MHAKEYTYRTLSVLCVLLSMVGGHWVFALIGLCIAALGGRWLLALVIGMVLDALYGSPSGMLHILQFPFLLLAFVLLVGKQLAATQLRQNFPDRL